MLLNLSPVDGFTRSGGRFRLAIAGLLTLALMGCEDPPVNNQARPVPEAVSVLEEPTVPDHASWANPLRATGGGRHFSPGAMVPFGRVQASPVWSAANNTNAADGSGAPKVIGFGVLGANADSGPRLIPLRAAPVDHTELPDHLLLEPASLNASPGYWAGRSLEEGFAVELTATRQVVAHRYRFPRAGRAYLSLVLPGKQVESLELMEAAAASGSGVQHVTGRFKRALKTNFVDVRFDRVIKEHRFLGSSNGESHFLLGFDSPDGSIQVHLAVSEVDARGAAGNHAELPHWVFEVTRRSARGRWNELLSRLSIQGNDVRKRGFYSALYHVLAGPRQSADSDGRYRDVNGEVRVATGDLYFDRLPLGLAYRASYPLLTLLVPEKAGLMAQSMLARHRVRGFLPAAGAGEVNDGFVNATAALPVLADAVLKELPGVDAPAALAAMVKTATVPHEGSPWDVYLEHHYYPYNLMTSGAVTRSLEASVGDAAVAAVARQMSEYELADRFSARSVFYASLMDPLSRVPRGRDSQGEWRLPFDPFAAPGDAGSNADFIAASAAQSFWLPAQHDVEGIMMMLGGRQGLTNSLDAFFEVDSVNAAMQSGLGDYEHGVPAVHHVPWLYAYSNDPDRGQLRLRQLAAQLDRARSTALPDEGGQLSAWYVFATLGFYPVNSVSGQYVLAAPLVPGAVLETGSSSLVIDAPRASAARPLSVESRYDGNLIGARTISHRRLISGGTLTHVMSDPAGNR